MTTTLLIIMLGFYLFSVIWSGRIINRHTDLFGTFAYCIVAGMSFYMLIHCLITTPSAMDVYRNRTTLKIIYEDNIPVDSIVIYKKRK